MPWSDDYYRGSSDYPTGHEPEDSYFDPWVEAERELDRPTRRDEVD
jgi:hypothetical protein